MPLKNGLCFYALFQESGTEKRIKCRVCVDEGFLNQPMVGTYIGLLVGLVSPLRDLFFDSDRFRREVAVCCLDFANCDGGDAWRPFAAGRQFTWVHVQADVAIVETQRAGVGRWGYHGRSDQPTEQVASCRIKGPCTSLNAAQIRAR